MRLCKAGNFSYGESPRTPPLEGTSLHRRNKTVVRSWGSLSLFTTCLRLRVKSPCHRVWHMSPTPGKAQWEERSHMKCQKNKNSKGRAGQTKGENETENEASRTDEGDILSTTLNSTNKKRTWVGEGPPPPPPPPPPQKKKAWKENNEKRKEPYCVNTTLKPVRRLKKVRKKRKSIWKNRQLFETLKENQRLKKESEQKHLIEKGALRNAERKRTTKKKS